MSPPLTINTKTRSGVLLRDAPLRKWVPIDAYKTQHACKQGKIWHFANHESALSSREEHLLGHREKVPTAQYRAARCVPGETFRAAWGLAIEAASP